jgi:ribonuclease BN (tRNA processing enzyme)
MRLTIIGCGDAFGAGGRLQTSFQVRSRAANFLIDCGTTSLIGMRRLGLQPNEIDTVFVSHLHGDHFGGLPFLFLDFQFLGQRTRPLVIAGPPGARARIDALLEVFFPRSSATRWRFPWEVVELAPNGTSEFAGLTTTTTEVIHFSGAPSTGVRISDGRSTLAYSGDTEWTDALVPLADGADLFIVECYEHARLVTGHISWSILSAKLSDLRARRIMITHMNPSMLARTQEANAVGVLVAEDGLSLDV